MSIVVNRKIKKVYVNVANLIFQCVEFVTHPCLSKHLQADTVPGGGGLGGWNTPRYGQEP